MSHLIIDYDNTIVNSSKAICQLYNELYCNHENFKPADWTQVNRWDLSDQCQLISQNQQNIAKLFSSQRFFEIIDFFPNAQETLIKLSEITDIVICTSGTAKNISQKVIWLEKHLPFAHIVPVILNGSDGYGKSIVNMKNSVFIDDHVENIISSNADFRILYGDVKDWNKSYLGLRLHSWLDENAFYIIKILLQYLT